MTEPGPIIDYATPAPRMKAQRPLLRALAALVGVALLLPTMALFLFALGAIIFTFATLFATPESIADCVPAAFGGIICGALAFAPGWLATRLFRFADENR